MQTKLGGALSLIGREALRIVLPAACVACGRELAWRDRVASCCGECWRALPVLPRPRCRSCALPLPAGEICIACSADPLPVGWCEAWGEYRASLERVLHAFKFERHDFLDDALGSLMADAIRPRDEAFDAIVPVPMHRSKLRRRGYNQAELLGRSLSRKIAVACEPGLLSKERERQTQSTLARSDRAANVRGVFTASERVRDRAVLLVDDISTTGETFRACAAALLEAGASRVCAVAVAKAT